MVRNTNCGSRTVNASGRARDIISLLNDNIVDERRLDRLNAISLIIASHGERIHREIP